MATSGWRSWSSGRAGLLLVVTLGTAASLFLRETAEIGELLPFSEAVELAQLADGSPRLMGRPSTVTAVLFTDYRCPACRQSDRAIMQTVREDGHVNLIVRPLILFGEESERGARAALAADRQGRFLAMHRALMSAPKIDDDGVTNASRRAGVDLKRLQIDLVQERATIDRAIARNRVAAFGLGISGTPSYLIGRYRVEGALSPREFRRLLRQARARELHRLRVARGDTLQSYGGGMTSRRRGRD